MNFSVFLTHYIVPNNKYRHKYIYKEIHVSFSVDLGWPRLTRWAATHAQGHNLAWSVASTWEAPPPSLSNRDFWTPWWLLGAFILFILVFVDKNKHHFHMFNPFSDLKNMMKILRNLHQRHTNIIEFRSLAPSPNLAAMDTKAVPQPSSSTSKMGWAGGYNLVLNGVYWAYNPLTNHLLTFWDI